MKSIIIKILGLALFLVCITNTYSQTEQMRKWAFNGKEVNFVGVPSAYPIPGTVSGASGAYASYYDENNDLVLRVIDNQVFNSSNIWVDELFTDTGTEDLIADQMIIAPAEQSNNC